MNTTFSPTAIERYPKINNSFTVFIGFAFFDVE